MAPETLDPRRPNGDGSSCDHCGGAFEDGYIETGRSMRWMDETDDEWARRAYIAPHIFAPRFPARRCTACRVVWFEY